MHQDRAMRLRQKAENKSRRTTSRVITAALAIIGVVWLLSTVQPIPHNNCTVATFDGHQGEYQLCK